MKIVALGGAGFLGGHVVERLGAIAERIVSVGRKHREHARDYIACDLFAEEAPLMKLLEGADACVHLAGDLVPGSAEAAGWAGFQRNLALADRLANACIESGVERLIFASSGGTVYGRDVLSAREDWACAPIGLYGAQKLAAESVLRARLHGTGTRLVILRLGNPFGPGQETHRAHGVIGRIFQSMLSRQSFTIWGDGGQVRDYVPVADVARAFALALIYDGPGHIYNIGSGAGVDMCELLARCARVSGIPLEYSYQPKASYEVERISLEIGAAARDLEWVPETGLDEGLAHYFHNLSESRK